VRRNVIFPICRYNKIIEYRVTIIFLNILTIISE